MAEKIRILIVDDQKLNLFLLQRILSKERYAACYCENAIDALKIFKKQDFDVLLLDVIMPGIDGFELHKLVRGINAKQPIIFLTSMVDDVNSTILHQVSSDQYTYYMDRSYSKKSLEAKIEQVVTIHQQQKAQAEYYRQLESELALAEDVQNIMLPEWCVLDENMITSSLYLPCSKVSGDIFDVIPLGNSKYLYFIGDVAGHGIKAALYMSAIQSLLQVSISSQKTMPELAPHHLLQQLNLFFFNNLDGTNYMTCLVAIVDYQNNHISYQSAGHPGLLCCSPLNGRTWEPANVQAGGIPIGWDPDYQYVKEDNIEWDFTDDTIFLAYTDGILDICNCAGETVPDEIFKTLLGRLSSEAELATIPFRLRKSLIQIGYEESPDDICIVAFAKRCSAPNVTYRFLSPYTSASEETGDEFSKVVNQTIGDEDLSTKVQILLSEFLNNVILHGLKGQRKTRNGILVRQEIRENEITIIGMDRGRNWEISSDQQKNLERLETQNINLISSGRGLAILDKIAYRISRNSYCGLNETIFSIKY